MPSERFDFPNARGEKLSALLDRPAGQPVAFALFAHCFTCGKDNLAAKRIAEGLTARGIAVLRFDFTGLGASEGEFANTNFSSNVADLVAAANHLRKMHQAPAILIGHSLGGAAVLAAAQPGAGGARGRHHRGAAPIRATSPACSGSTSPRSTRRARSRSRSPAGRSASARNSSTTSPSRSSNSACAICARRCWCCIRRPTIWSASRTRARSSPPRSTRRASCRSAAPIICSASGATPSTSPR